MTVRERILALRLMEKEEKNPEYAKKIGMHVSIEEKETHLNEERRKNNV